MVRLRRIGGHLRPRRLRLYGVGNGKSGTTSLTRMFGSYRVAHEINSQRIRPVGASVLRGQLAVDSVRVRAELKRRSLRYHLEVDVAGHLSVFAGTLARMYPDAKFVLLIRDCFSWLDSTVDQQVRDLQAGIPRDSYFDAKYLRYGDRFASEEAVLEDSGLIPIAAWLRGWADMIDRVLGAVPSDRLAVVRTEDLDDSLERLARFAGVPETTVRPVHANRNPSPTGLLSEIPAGFVIDRAREHCEPIMRRHWGPDWRDLAARIRRRPIG